MKPTKKEKQQAQELGKQAFLDGKSGIPCLDKNLTPLLKGRIVGEGAPLLKAWSRGWDIANINQEKA